MPEVTKASFLFPVPSQKRPFKDEAVDYMFFPIKNTPLGLTELCAVS